MQELIDRLGLLIKESGANAFFNYPSSINDINHLSEKISISIPDNLKLFYANYDGGFIADGRWTQDELFDKSKFDLIQWNSNHFLSLDMLDSIFMDVDSLVNFHNEMSPPEEQYLPFFRAQDQELYVFKISTLTDAKPVFRLGRQVSPEYWTKINNDFSGFLDTFILKKGNILDW